MKEDGLQAQLLEDYRCVDSSTVLAIASDFDLCDPAQMSNLRQILDTLKEAVPIGEATGFDASGASGSNIQPGGLEAGGENDDSISGSGKSMPCWKSETDDTSTGISMSISDLHILDSHTNVPSSRDESPDKSYTSTLDDLDDKSKEAALLGIFPILKEFDIVWALKKYKGDASQAIDELMTQSFLEENGSRHKGIEAFSEGEIAPQALKSKRQKKRKKRRAATEDTGSQEKEGTAVSKWETAKQDIDFIASKTGMPEQQVSSLYHKHGGSAKASISAIIEAYRDIYAEMDDPGVHVEAYNLKRDFPSANLSDLEILIHLTSPSLPNAHALARRLATSSPTGKSKIQLEFRHAPIDLHETASSTSSTSAIVPLSPLADPSAAASSYTATRNEYFNRAAAYYRKGKSDPLMGGAAAYYATEGRSYNVLAKQATSAAADILVNQQSSGDQLDLHGVSVKDALRITRERVTGWWVSRQNRENKGIGGGYRIVTGVIVKGDGGSWAPRWGRC
ncbi:hypothetical protein HYALB_00006387 [Hymenoscyphus albidus]|uniref:DUF1771 domain-containing protein n=1 Tax=Hymenoscyphus albidus TaxID=595503 RepID=A0A9N9LGB1_9HELO|nr:hypothetical protein HYALB_00006387 [Hymenoscyphus albidus]